MPIYEYLCEKCEHEFEREQRITDPPVKTCPTCRSRRVKKLISQTSFVLKGSGWYSDLYSSSGDKKEKKTDDSDAKASSEAKKSEGDKKPTKDSKSKKKTETSKKSSKSAA